MSLASEKTQMEMEIWNIITGGTVEPRIVIVGCGGASARILERIGEHLRSIPRVLINTDMDGLRHADVDRKICIGKGIVFNGDSGGFPEVAERCAELASDEIRSCLVSKDVAFIIAGYGGGTGTAVAPMVAEMARGLGMVTFSICILPFSAEASRRKLAEERLDIIRGISDSTVVLDNDTLLKLGKNVTMEHAFHLMDRNVVKLINDVMESMSRNFMATLAGEIMACQTELEMANMNSMVLREADMGAYADPGMAPPAYPQPSDMNLINAGGMFQRS